MTTDHQCHIKVGLKRSEPLLWFFPMKQESSSIPSNSRTKQCKHAVLDFMRRGCDIVIATTSSWHFLHELGAGARDIVSERLELPEKTTFSFKLVISGGELRGMGSCLEPQLMGLQNNQCLLLLPFR